MKRIAFVVLYLAGLYWLTYVGNPWSGVSVLLSKSASPEAMRGVPFYFAVVVALALVALAWAHGRKVNRPNLFWLPLGALLTPGIATVAMVMFGATLTQNPGDLKGLLLFAISLTSAYLPTLLHLLCCVIGAIPAATNPERGEANGA